MSGFFEGITKVLLMARRGVGGPDDGAAAPIIPLNVDEFGSLKVIQTQGGTQTADLGQGAVDDFTEGATSLVVTTYTMHYNENDEGWDRTRGNTDKEVLAQDDRSATVNSADFTNFNSKGLHLIINVTAIDDSPSVVPHIQGKDPVSGEYYDILVGDAIETVSTTVLKVYPGIAGLNNAAANDILPRTWRVRMVHADGDEISYSVGASIIV